MSHIYIFLKKSIKTNLKFFEYQISASVETLEKQWASKANIRTFLLLNNCNFKWKALELPKKSKQISLTESVAS